MVLTFKNFLRDRLIIHHEDIKIHLKVSHVFIMDSSLMPDIVVFDRNELYQLSLSADWAESLPAGKITRTI